MSKTLIPAALIAALTATVAPADSERFARCIEPWVRVAEIAGHTPAEVEALRTQLHESYATMSDVMSPEFADAAIVSMAQRSLENNPGVGPLGDFMLRDLATCLGVE